MPPTDDDQLRALAAAATPGPWHWSDHRVPDLIGIAGNENYSYECDNGVHQATAPGPGPCACGAIDIRPYAGLGHG